MYIYIYIYTHIFAGLLHSKRPGQAMEKCVEGPTNADGTRVPKVVPNAAVVRWALNVKATGERPERPILRLERHDLLPQTCVCVCAYIYIYIVCTCV